MTTVPLTALLSAALALGIYLVMLYLRGVRKPVVVGLHLLLGFGGLETLVVLLKGTPYGDGLPAGSFGNVAAGFLAFAGFTGLLTPILGKGSRMKTNIMLVTHAAVGCAGFLFSLAWAYGQ